MMQFLSGWLRSAPQRRVVIPGLLFLVILGVFVLGDVSHAAEWYDFFNPVLWITFALGQFVSILVSLIGNILLLLIYILLAVAQYNDFIKSTAVVEGWKIVRDVANMGFVFVLMAIAIGTIIGNDKYHWQKNLPNLIGAAILINFSKTICGLVIDFAQIVMLTFVGAFAGASGGGNFAAMLGIPRLLEMTVAGGDKGAVFNTSIPVMGFLLALGFMIVACVVVGVIVLQLFIRIIALWFLIVLSPMAFFLYSFPDGKSLFDKWLKSFMEYVMVGPVMAFFLWLSLTVVSAASVGKEKASHVEIASQIGFKSGGTVKDGVGLSVGNSAIGTVSGVASYILGIGMLIGSLVVSQQIGGAGAKYATGAIKGLGDWATGKKGPSPMRWARERFDAFSQIKNDERLARAGRDGKRIVGGLNIVKALPGKIVAHAGRAAMAHIPQVRAAKAGFDAFKMGSGRFGGLGGFLFGGKHMQNLSKSKADHTAEATKDRAAAAAKLKEAEDERAAGHYPAAANLEGEAYEFLNKAESHDTKGLMDGMLMGLPKLGKEIGKFMLAGSGLGLPAAALAYGPGIITDLRNSGEAQIKNAANALSAAMEEGVGKMNKLSASERKGVAMGSEPGYSDYERAAAIRSMVRNGEAKDTDIDWMREKYITSINADPAEIRGFEADVLSRNPGKATGVTADNLAQMIADGDVKADSITKHSVDDKFLEALEKVAATDPAKAKKAIENFSKDKPEVEKAIRDGMETRMGNPHANPAAPNAHSAGGTYTADYEARMRAQGAAKGDIAPAMGFDAHGNWVASANPNTKAATAEIIRRACQDKKMAAEVLLSLDANAFSGPALAPILQTQLTDPKILDQLHRAAQAGSDEQKERFAGLVDTLKRGAVTHAVQQRAARIARKL